jgi:uncharacterized protein YeaO (DUF488 family)
MSSKEIEKAKIFYDEWRKETTFSPALNTSISVTKKGWNHIVNKKRNYKDMFRRINLLDKARQLIKKSSTIQDYRQIDNRIYIAFEHIFSFDKKYKTRVVLESINGGPYTFLSVMDKKI